MANSVIVMLRMPVDTVDKLDVFRLATRRTRTSVVLEALDLYLTKVAVEYQEIKARARITARKGN